MARKILSLLMFLCFLYSAASFGEELPSVVLRLDTSEADQALSILTKRARQEPITSNDWGKLFATAPYGALKARDASFGHPFSDEEFQPFLLSPAAHEQEPTWRKTIASMKQADMAGLGRCVVMAPNWGVHSRKGVSGDQADAQQFRMVIPHRRPSDLSFYQFANQG